MKEDQYSSIILEMSPAILLNPHTWKTPFVSYSPFSYCVVSVSMSISPTRLRTLWRDALSYSSCAGLMPRTCWTFTHLCAFNKYLLSTFYVPYPELQVRYMSVNCCLQYVHHLIEEANVKENSNAVCKNDPIGPPIMKYSTGAPTQAESWRPVGASRGLVK